MNNRKWGDFTRMQIAFHLLLFLFSITAVVLIYPREGKFRYEYQKGRPWLHESLMAPWDFPVRKPEAELRRERDSVLATFAPFFDYDTALTQYQLGELETYLKYRVSSADSLATAEFAESDIAGLQDVAQKLLQMVAAVYDSGILEVSDVTDAVLTNNSRITVVKGRIATEVSLNGIYTHRDAYANVNSMRNRLSEELTSAGRTGDASFAVNVDLFDYIQPNLFYNEERSSSARNELLRSVSASRGVIQERELIVNRGEIVNQETFQILESLRTDYEQRLGRYGSWVITLGRFILVIACYLVLYLFLYHFRRNVLKSFQKTFFIILLVLLFIVITRFVVPLQGVSVYIIPFGLIAIIVRTFYDSRLALFILLVTIMLAGSMVPNSFEFVFMTFISGVVAIFSLTNLNRRGRLFFSSLMVVLSYSIVYFGMGVIQEGTISGIEWRSYGWFAANGVLLLLVFPISFLFEKTFGFLSDATLFELSDTNQPLLRRLAEEAPGSFQHSLQVANLAGEAAQAIGANYLLVRVGALYHDIGKLVKPEYFTENSAEGFNPHEKLTPEDSARLIIQHIEHGVESARRYNLPSQIVDFIKTHQGTTTAWYFYHKYLEENKGESVDESLFAYPGPKPFTRETAVLMMTDSVEAASRSLGNYTKESINDIVESVISNQIKDGQFTDAPITFRDISVIKEVFKKRLETIYHARIAYPTR